MSALQLDVRLFSALSGSTLTAAERDLVVDLCESAVATVSGMDVPHPGRAVRSAVLLMLDYSVPSPEIRVRHQLAWLCELAVLERI